MRYLNKHIVSFLYSLAGYPLKLQLQITQRNRVTFTRAQYWNSRRRVIIRLMFSLFKTNLKLKIAATASTYLRGEAGWQEAGMILLGNDHNKFSMFHN